jgi:hypothetical protein
VPYQRKLYVTRSGVDQNVRTSAEADDSHCPLVLINPRPPAKIEPPPLPVPRVAHNHIPHRMTTHQDAVGP